MSILLLMVCLLSLTAELSRHQPETDTMLPINYLNQSVHSDLPLPLAVRPKVAARMLGCGITRLYELLGAGELEAYKDGGSRMITTRSIIARVERLADAAKASRAT